MSLFERLRNWWSKDTVERAEEESRDHVTPLERDLDREEFEGRRADLASQEYTREAGVDFERDSRPPRDY